MRSSISGLCLSLAINYSSTVLIFWTPLVGRWNWSPPGYFQSQLTLEIQRSPYQWPPEPHDVCVKLQITHPWWLHTWKLGWGPILPPLSATIRFEVAQAMATTTTKMMMPFSAKLVIHSENGVQQQLGLAWPDLEHCQTARKWNEKNLFFEGPRQKHDSWIEGRASKEKPRKRSSDSPVKCSTCALLQTAPTCCQISSILCASQRNDDKKAWKLLPAWADERDVHTHTHSSSCSCKTLRFPVASWLELKQVNLAHPRKNLDWHFQWCSTQLFSYFGTKKKHDTKKATLRG